MTCHRGTYQPRRCAPLFGALLAGALIFLSLCPASAGVPHATKTTLLANREFAPALLQGIREARTSIVCCYYLFKLGDSRDNLPRLLAGELIKASQRGVAVTVILETQGKNKDRLDSDNHATAAMLSRGGVTVFFDTPAITTHTKVTVIDGRYVYLGSHNLTQGALRLNNELSLFLDSPEIAAELTSYLDRL